MQHRSIAQAVLVAAALGAASAAQADPNQQASISNVRITLVDLDPNDGIAPAITFVEGGYIATWLSSSGAAGLVDPQELRFPLGAAASTARSDGARQSASFAVQAGSILGPGPGPGPGATAAHFGSGEGGVAGEAQVIFTDFTLTPNTRIEIRATGYASTAGYVGAGGYFDAWAGAGVNLFSRTLQLSYSIDFINAYSNASGPVTPWVGRDLYAAYDNATSVPFSASISAVAYLGASEAAAAPVPEPATGLLLAAGLLTLARLRRR